MGDKIASFLGIAFWIVVIGLFIFGSIGSSGDNSSSSSNSYDTSTSEDDGQSTYDSTYDEPDYEYSEAEPEYEEADFSNYDYNPDYDSTTDLDCSDFGYEHYVGSYDPHGLDGDGDGYACESY